MRTTRALALAVSGLAMVGLLATVPAEARALAIPSTRLAPATPPVPAPTSQIIEIDSRFITVELAVYRSVGGAPIDPPASPTTSVHVTLSADDGAALPAGLDAVGVRFEKLRGVNRFFFTPITESDAAAIPDEHVQQDYAGDLSDHPSVQYLRAVVRLELDGEVIKVPMGIIRVNTLLLP